MSLSMNDEQSCYVIKNDCYVTTRGYQSLLDETNHLARRLNLRCMEVDQSELGQASVWDTHSKLVEIAGSRNIGTWFHGKTTAKIRRTLEKARKSNEVLRVFYGDTATGKDWLEEYEVIGRVGRSTGALKVPILVSEGHAGGGAMLDHCIVRIIRVSDQKELVRHRHYHQGEITIGYIDGTDKRIDPDYCYEVLVDGEVHARFTSQDKAFAWLAFINGYLFHHQDLE